MKLRSLLATVAVVVTMGFGGAAVAQADEVTTAEQLYSTPGVHKVNGRYWKTTCETYSTTVIRCTTDIYATKVFLRKGQWYTNNDWVFNNLSYLPSPRTQWKANNLGNKGPFTGSDGRKWRTDCDSPATGRGACRNYAVATVASLKNGKVVQENMEIFNSVVLFSSSTKPWVKGIPAAAPARSDVPAATTPLPIGVSKPAVPVRPVAPKPVAPKPSGGVPPISRNSCPASAPIKGNADSGIYHKPGQSFYNRTNPEVCFASDSDAVRAGFRKAKR